VLSEEACLVIGPVGRKLKGRDFFSFFSGEGLLEGLDLVSLAPRLVLS
jgi:hypothetical protein